MRGCKEWNLLNLDLERQIAHGIHDPTSLGFVIAEAIGTKNFYLTNHVKQIRDGEEKNDTLWFNDIDAIEFSLWHESYWRTENLGT